MDYINDDVKLGSLGRGCPMGTSEDLRSNQAKPPYLIKPGQFRVPIKKE